MTRPLEETLKMLSPEDLEEVAALAESILEARQSGGKPGRSEWKFDWIGGLSDDPEQSGVEAQHAAIRQWKQMIGKGLSK